MDLDRMKQPDRESLCRQYFYFGFAGLPFLWAVNVIWFGNFVFLKKNSTSPSSSRTSPNSPTDTRPDIRSRNVNPNGGNNNDNTLQQADIDLDFEKSMKRIRCYVILSLIGLACWVIILTTWIIIYQNNRASWTEFGDYISYNIPRGIP